LPHARISERLFVTTLQQPTAAPVVAPTTGRERLRLVLVLGALVALGPLTIDMYLPALPTIVRDLGTTDAAVQLTLTGTLVGLALGQLLVGPLSDTFGRRRPLLVGVAVHVLASLLCLVAPNVGVLGGLRLLQGVGAAAASVVAMAIVRDLFVGRAAATLFSRLMLVLGVAPVLAPTIGGEVLRFTSWRGVFVVLAVLALLMIIMAARAVPETLPAVRRRPLGLRSTLRTYGGLLRDRTFVGLVLVAGLAMAGLFGYVAGSSFVFQEEFGLDEQQFGLLFGAGAIFLIGGTQLNAALLRWFEPRAILPAALALAVVAGAVLVTLSLMGVGGLVGVLAPLWTVLFATGLVMPNAPTLALARHGEAAGTAAALLGAIQMGTGAVVSPVVGVLGNDALAMGAVMAGGAALALVVLLVVVRPWTLADLES
jgi:DHA1 family bicyclomycin/chloramphenicol resistance-like MFS transporter